MSKDANHIEIAKLIYDYCIENDIRTSSIWWDTVGLEMRKIELDERDKIYAEKRAIVDEKMLNNGYINIESAASQIGMRWENISLLIRKNKIKPLYMNSSGEKVNKSQASRDGTYINLDDIDTIPLLYEETATISTNQAAERMGVTPSTFSKWASRAGIEPHDKRLTNNNRVVHLWKINQVNQVIAFRESKTK